MWQLIFLTKATISSMISTCTKKAQDEALFVSVATTVCTGKENRRVLEENSKIWSAIVANCSTEFTFKVGAKIV